MRGADRQTDAMFSYLSPEAMVPEGHALRLIRPIVNAALERLSRDFNKLYAVGGRGSIAPEKLLRALLLQAFHSVRSERQLMEQINYNMLFRWFVGMSMDAAVWDVTVFTKNRERLVHGDIARAFFQAVLAAPEVQPLLSSEHFPVDGTLLGAWASMKSFRPKDGSGEPPAPGRNGERDFHGEKRSNETHASSTDPDARLARKSNGQAARLCYAGHVVMENRHGLVVGEATTLATGTAERDAGQAMMGPLARRGRTTLGADKNYDTQGFVAAMGAMGVTAQVAQHKNGRRSAIDCRTTRHAEYAVSQVIRKRTEEVFGWGKEVGGMRRMRLAGLARVGWAFTLRVTAYNLVRLPKLVGAAA